MSKLDDNMQDILNLPEETVDVIAKPKREVKEDVTQDYEYTRGQLYNLIDKGQEALNGILDVAASSDHPRAYEVAALMIKNVADTTDKLMKLQKETKEVKEEGMYNVDDDESDDDDKEKQDEGLESLFDDRNGKLMERLIKNWATK